MSNNIDNNENGSNLENVEELLESCSELTRCISRVSYVGMGISDELDLALNKLRTSIKDKESVKNIKGEVDSIGNLLRTMDDHENDQAIELANDKVDFLNILLKKQLPKNLKKDLKTVKNTNNSDDAATVIHSIAEVIQQYISQVESSVGMEDKKPEKKAGFLSSLFGKADNQKIPAVEPSDKTETPISSINLPQEIKDSLKLLINQLSSMEGYSGIADSINQEISNIEKIEQLSEILEMITSAFVEISDQEHVQFEKFLKTLNNRIIRVNDFINQTLKFSQQSDSDSKQLNLELTSNFTGMKDSLTSSATLEDAKTAVFSHMDTVVSQLNKYCLKQESNSAVLVSQMDTLSEQLRATEDEATRLKDELAEQRVRAQTDPLTNLPNRYSYNERLTQEYNRWRRYRHALTLVIGDIDLFKRVNDEHGHSFGDKVLKEIANYLSNSVRESDFIARFGGEEFIILLPETGIVDATRAINKIRSGVSKLELLNGSERVPVSMSFGISEFENDDTTKAVFERADKALYRAKEKGRNLVCCQRSKSS